MLKGTNLSAPIVGIKTPPASRTAFRVLGTTLNLAQPNEPVPEDWQQAITGLCDWLGIRIEHVPQRGAKGLKEVVNWAKGDAPLQAAPVFAPWQSCSPVLFQNSLGHGLPAGDWIGSYLLDHAVGKTGTRAGLDVLLMSPHPAACRHDDGCGTPLPQLSLIKTMIGAARFEGRKKLAIIVHARSRNSVIKQLLLADRSLTREGITVDIVAIEDALANLVRSAGRWDAIIAMPDLRSIVFALMAQANETQGPWPMLVHGRNLAAIGAEALNNGSFRLLLNAPLLVQSLALAAFNAGLTNAARRLHEGAAQLSLRGVITQGEHSIAPYVTKISDAEYIRLICAGAAISTRAIPEWRAFGGIGTPANASKPSRLHVVAPI